MFARTLVGTVCTTATLVGFAIDGAALAQQVGQSTAKSIDVASARRDFFDAHLGADFFERGDRITRVFGKAFSQGRSPVESANAFLRDSADVFGVATNDLVPYGAFPDGSHAVDVYWDEATESYRFTLLGYSQVVSGVPVFRATLKLLMRNEAGFPLVLASSELRNLADFPSTIVGRPTIADFDSRTWSSQAIRNPALAQATDAQLVIFAGVDDMPAKPTMAVSFFVERGAPGENYSKMLYVVDAASGKVLFEEEQVCNADITGTVQGLCTTGWGADACTTEAATPLQYAAVGYGTAGGVVYANDLGAFTVPNAGTGSLALTSNMFVGGKYFKVDDISGAESILNVTTASGGTAYFTHNLQNLTEQDRAEVNAYRHANICRDFIMAANPTYPVIAGQQNATAFQINVNLASTCNAYYDGPSINFYTSGGGCNNTAFSTVVHHEFGHHMVASGGSGQGAYGEGMGDVVGALISETAMLAVGFQNCSTGIRNAANTCTYSSTGCSSCGSEIHACGQLISGCVWDTRTAMASAEPANFRTIMRNLAVNSVLLHGGTTIAADITIDFLTLDDNNADINDGTPHYTQINGGFTAHGLPGPAISPLRFTVANGIPAFATPNATKSLTVTVEALGAQPQANTGVLYWRTGTGSFQSVAMTQGSANVYTALVPIGACGTSTNYYFEAKTTANVVVTGPATAPTAFHSTSSGYAETVIASADFETAGTWVVGAAGDAATTGLWTRVDPLGTTAQPENDHSEAGTICYVTGQGTVGGALGEADVDGGATTLTSPTFNALGQSDATVSYWRWYSNNTGPSPNADSMPIQISNNNGTTWVSLEVVTENASAWVYKSFRIADFVTPSATMKVKFVPSDTGSGSIIEAGVDDFRVSGLDCTAPYVPGDLNQDGSVNGVDLASLLSGWGTAAGDCNSDGVTDGLDLSILLSAWTG